MPGRFLALVLMVAGLWALAAPVSADTTVFSDLSAFGNAYNEHTAWVIQGSAAAGGSASVATPFTPAANFNLDSVDLAIAALGNEEIDVDLSINSDNGGVPGQALESWNFFTPYQNAFFDNPPVVINSVIKPLLRSGQQYWVVALPNSLDAAQGGWNWNSTNAVGVLQSGDGGSTWASPGDSYPAPAYEVTGDVVPEPSALALLMLGACVFAGPILRKHARGNA